MFVYIIPFSFFLFIFYCYWVQKFSKHARMVNQFPGPKIVPVLGNLLELHTTPDNIFRYFRANSKKYKRTYRTWTGPFIDVHIITAEDAEILLTSQKHIRKSLIYDFLNDWLGKGLLTSTGNHWQLRRKLLTPAFHFNILQKFTKIFGDHSMRLVEELKAECTKDKTNITEYISQITLHAICETAMGTVMDPKNEKQKNYFNCIHRMASLTVYRIVSPWLYNNFIFYLTSTGKKHLKTVKYMRDFTADVIKDRQDNFQDIDPELVQDDEDGKRKKLAMLDLLIYAKQNRNAIDDEGIKDEVNTFMFEGHDTTSVGISYALLLLSANKEHQEKVVEELEEIFVDSNRAATYDDLQKMQYLELCIKESLRLFPSVPLIARNLEHDLQLTRGVVPAGSTCGIQFYDLHRDERFFPDPEKFDPDRFLPENFKLHPFAYLPFSAGPRNCIGQKFAMLEMKSIISAILRYYILEPVDKVSDLKFVLDFVLRNDKAINIKFKLRK